MLHLTKAATVKKVNYLTERACGDTLLLQHREKLQKNSFFFFFEAFRRLTGGSRASAAIRWSLHASALNRFLSRGCCIFPCKERVKNIIFSVSGKNVADLIVMQQSSSRGCSRRPSFASSEVTVQPERWTQIHITA